MVEYRKKFIALDLETTHLGMEEGRIMEVGAAETELFFDEKENKVKAKFGKTFDKLINPETAPSQTALALTGIKAGELKAAPLWRDIKKELEIFLGGAVLLGQNVVFDLDFLKNQGVRKKYAFVDTLDIALTFLPMFPVHSLEYLSQEFGAPEGKAHRALADCQNTAHILTGMLNEFLSFAIPLQRKIRDYLSSSTISYRDLFLDLPNIQRAETRIPHPSFLMPPSKEGEEGLGADWPDKTIVSLPLGLKQEARLLQNLSYHQAPGLVAASHPAFLENWPQERVIADPAWALCSRRFEWLENQSGLSDSALKVLIKLSIFRNFTRSLDLSKIKWGNIDRGIIPLILAHPVACRNHKCAYIQELRLDSKSVYLLSIAGIFSQVFIWTIDYPKKRLLLFDLPQIEEELVESATQSWNLRKVRQCFLALFPIEKGLPSRFTNLPKQVEEVLNEIDLFFGILHLVYLKNEGEFAENLIVSEEERSTDRFRKFFHPAQKLVGKLRALTVYLHTQLSMHSELEDEFDALNFSLNQFIKFLESFFIKAQSTNTYWLQFNSQWVDLNCSPAEIAKEWQKFQSAFSGLTIVDTELPDISFKYYQARLGLGDFKISFPKDMRQKQDLEAVVFEKTPTITGLVDFCENLDGRTLVIVPNEGKLTEFIEIFTSRENQKKELLAYRFSGNLTLLQSKLKKMSEQGIALLTLNIFLKNFQLLPPFANLVLVRLPFEAPGTRPDLMASGRSRFADHALPRSVTILHTILSRFASCASDSAKAFFLDSRILTDYDQTFLKYLEGLPRTRLSTTSRD